MISELPPTATEHEINQLDAAAQDLKGHAARIHKEIIALADCLTKTMLTSDNTVVRHTGVEAMSAIAALLNAASTIDYRADDLEREHGYCLSRKTQKEAV